MKFYSGATGPCTREVSAYAGEDICDIDFKLLGEIAGYKTSDGKDITGYPEDILSIDGKRVRIVGHFLLPIMASTGKPCSEFGVSRYGINCPCCTGLPNPSQFNTIIVQTGKDEALSPPFSPYIEVEGVFRCRKEYYQIGGKSELAAIFFIEGEKYRKIEPAIWEKIIGNK